MQPTEFRSQNENAPTMNLGEDVVSDILLRLPVRLLLRFKCVCKDWYALINTSLFKDTYLARAVDDDQVVGLKVRLISDGIISDHRVLDSVDDDDEYDDEIGIKRNGILRFSFTLSVTCWYGDYQSLALSASDPSSSSSCNDFELSGFELSVNYSGGFRIVNHVNGIVCFINGDNWFDITLVNPALRETRQLPIPMFDLGGFKPYALRTGFGYDDVSDDYKVVVIVTVFEDEEQGLEGPYKHIVIVYLLSTNTWKILGDVSEFVSRPFACLTSDESVFSHGSIHWCVGWTDIDDNVPCYWIIAFDVTNELFREIPFPHGWRYFSVYADDYGMFPHLFLVDRSTIALVNSTNQASTCPKLEVWVMKEYGDTSDSWTKLCSINNLPEFSWPISFWKKDKLLLVSRVPDLICYDLLKGQLDEHEEESYIGGSGLVLVTGHESFVSVKQVL